MVFIIFKKSLSTTYIQITVIILARWPRSDGL